MGRPPAAGDRGRPDQGDLQRAQSAQPLPPLGPVHGSRQLERPRRRAPPRPARSGGVSDPINIRALAPGTRITLADGAEAEIVSNPADGVWLFARYLSSPRDPALVGQEDMVFAADVVDVRPAG